MSANMVFWVSASTFLRCDRKKNIHTDLMYESIRNFSFIFFFVRETFPHCTITINKQRKAAWINKFFKQWQILKLIAKIKQWKIVNKGKQRAKLQGLKLRRTTIFTEASMHDDMHRIYMVLFILRQTQLATFI